MNVEVRNYRVSKIDEMPKLDYKKYGTQTEKNMSPVRAIYDETEL